LEALERRVHHGVFGYTEPDGRYHEAVQNWFWERHGWRTEEAWLTLASGVMPAIHSAILAFTAPGDAVVIQEPVYYPFAEAVRLTGRRLVVNELPLDGDGRYTIDLEGFERKVLRTGAQLLLLCSPHNPVGRVWTEGELRALGEVCLRHGVKVVADEIHQDFVYGDNRHTVFAGLSDELADITVTCTAPTKTFNLAGVGIANIFIGNEALRGAFRRAQEKSGLSGASALGLTACRAAYEGGQAWLAELLSYLGRSMEMVEVAAEGWRGARFNRPEGTYLTWIGFHDVLLTDTDLSNFLLKRARVWLSDGHQFGAGGSGYMRLNAATTHSLLREALERISEALR
jgi:cystathionine beta-lyase